MEEYCFRGIPVSEGVAIGKLVILDREEELVPPAFSIGFAEVDREIQRYRQALSSSRCDLQRLQRVMFAEGSDEAVTIIDTHIQMLEDPLITTLMEQKIQQMLQNTESVFRSVIGDYEKQFLAIEDQMFKQRLIDVKDLSQRILKHLYPPEEVVQPLPKDSIIFAKELAPSDAIEACVSKVGGFISEHGGSTAHAALIARAKGFPYVTNIEMKNLEAIEGSIVVVDGVSGKVIINPSLETLKYYEQLKEDVLHQDKKLMDDLHFDALTQDGVKMTVLANFEKLSDFDHPFFQGAEGIGLCRSEFLFAQNDILSISEQEQYIYYSQILQKAGSLPLVFRVFDVGNDKGLLDEAMEEEANPALGCRAIRFLLRHQEVFKRQLKAIFRASIDRSVSLLFPLIADVSELRKIKQVISEVKQELLENQVSFSHNLPVGCMIEVPSAALACETLARECDFFSIGTNDLIQYAFAMDRGYNLLSENYKSMHPAILKMLKMIIDVGRAQGKKVSICGEIASNPLFIKLLLGLGIESVSCAPRYIPLIKKTVRSISYAQAKRLADYALTLGTAQEIEELIIRDYERLEV